MLIDTDRIDLDDNRAEAFVELHQGRHAVLRHFKVESIALDLIPW